MIRPILNNYLFVHIPRTAGTSICKKYNLPNGHEKVKGNRKSFAIVRNPYDRLVSCYFYLKSGGINKYDRKHRKQYIEPYKTFRSFVIDGGLDRAINNQQHFRSQTYYTHIGIELKVDHILRFENLQNDWNKFCDIINIKDKTLPKINSSKHEPFDYYYDMPMKYIVYEKYHMDFINFNYTSI